MKKLLIKLIKWAENRREYYSGTPYLLNGKLKFRHIPEGTVVRADKDPSMETLEEISLKALYRHCPLCGVIGKNHYCKECDFTWEEGKLYFSNTNNLWKS